MDKYSEEIVTKYINGEDIINYSIEELENDPKFMIQVIKKTNDKNFYNLCGDEVKKDFSFIKNMIMNFSNDIDFINKIIDYYMKDINDDQNLTELILLICIYTQYSKNKEYNRYKTYREIIYIDKLAKIEQTKKEFQNEPLILDEIGMGFFFIHDYYQHSTLTLKYFAKRFITDMFKENNMSLEKLVHSKFKTYKDLENYGIRKYLIDLISIYDRHLSEYVTVHISILKPSIIEIKKTKNNWDEYLIKQEKLKYEMMIEEVHNYMKDLYMEKLNFVLTEECMLYYVGKILGIEDKIEKYIGLCPEHYNTIKENTEYLIQCINFDIETIQPFLKVKQIMVRTLELEVSKETQKKQNGKILKLLCHNQ